MKFVKSISLILLFTIFGINGVFAQDQDDVKPFILEGFSKDLMYNIWKDAYVVVFRGFAEVEEKAFFDQYPYDVEFPEGIEYTPQCDHLFSEIVNLSSERGPFVLATYQAGFLLNINTNCSDSINSPNIFPLIHPTLRNQDGLEAFVIHLKDIMRSQPSLLETISEAQNALNNASSDEYTTALQIRSLILEIDDNSQSESSRGSALNNRQSLVDKPQSPDKDLPFEYNPQSPDKTFPFQSIRSENSEGNNNLIDKPQSPDKYLPFEHNIGFFRPSI